LLDEWHHVAIRRFIANALEIGFFIPDLVTIAQSPENDTLAAWLKHDSALATGDP
jgi:hypothetical protein